MSDNLYDVIASVEMPACRADAQAEWDARRPSRQDLARDAYYDRMDARHA